MLHFKKELNHHFWSFDYNESNGISTFSPPIINLTKFSLLTKSTKFSPNTPIFWTFPKLHPSISEGILDILDYFGWFKKSKN